MSPTNSSRIGRLGAGRVEVDDAAADAELAGLVDRVLAGVAGRRRAGRRDRSARSRGRATASAPRREQRSGALSRGSSAAAEAMTSRAVPVLSACSARARAEAMSKCGARPRYGIDFVRRERQDRRARPRRPTGLRARRGRSGRPTVSCSTSASVGTTRSDRPARRGGRGEQRLGRRRQARTPAGRAHPSRAGRRPT